MKHGTGCIPSGYDARDYGVHYVAAAALPTRFKLDINWSYDQGVVCNCPSQGWRSLWRKWFGIEFGVDHTYGGARDHEFYGLYMKDIADFAVKHGIAPLSVDPGNTEIMDVVDYYHANKDRLDAAAAPYAGGSWGRPNSMMDIKQCVYDGVPVPVCFAWTGRHPGRDGILRCDAPTRGYHCMDVIGWTEINGVDHAIVLNSHSPDWGINGTAYVPWEDVMLCNDAVIHTMPKDDDIITPIMVTPRTLRKGMTGADVVALQEQLIRIGFDLGPWGADGDFGGATKSAVEAFQRMHALKADGIFGPQTRAVLETGAEWEDPKPGKRRRLVQWGNDHIGMMYVWGGNGQAMTEKLIRKMETSARNIDRALTLFHTLQARGVSPILGFDCSGLISRFLQNEGLVPSKRNSRHLYNMCKKIDCADLTAGDLVFRHNGVKIYHVGIYAGNDTVIEAMGRDAGVVKRHINASGVGYWNRYGRLSILED